MNLQETVKALEAKGITVAITLGVHQHCAIDSNCPIAVELRRLVVDAGVTLEQLLEGYEAVTATDPVNYDLPEIDGKVAISIAGTSVQLDLDDIIGEQIKTAMDRKRRELGEQQARIQRLGGSLYHSYLTAIALARDSRTLPQLSFPVRELLGANCLVTTDGDKYAFLFPVEYKPEYLVTGGIRYKMVDRDIRATTRQVYLKFIITRENRFYRASLHEGTGDKFRHYHGDSTYDCWGAVTLPRQWDGRLRSLTRLITTLMGSLATINLDSLLNSHPSGMPYKSDLLERSVELGREGELEHQEEATPAEGWATGEEEPRTGWGRGRRTGRTLTPQEEPTVELTRPEQEARRMARFNMTNAPTNMELTCNLCGEEAGHHHGGGVFCPRDRVWERMRT